MTINTKKITDLINSFFLITIGWLIVVPLSLLVRKQKGLFVVIGRTGNNFADNTKYFYLYLQKNHPKNKSYFISDTKNFNDKVPGFVKHPSLKSIFLLMRAEFIVIDYSAWYLNFKYHLSIKAKKIQLWHGIGSKRIELSTDQFTQSKFSRFRIIFGALRGQIIRYDLLSSTSDYYSENLYRDSLKFKEIKEFGQPRNDVLFREPVNGDLIGTDTKIMSKLISAKNTANTKIVLYTPTYRATLSNDIIEYKKLNHFAKEHNIIVVVKHHVLAVFDEIPKMSNIFNYDKRKDIYPLMSVSDVMITDYSSIYLDYILLNKPIIYYIPDFDEYKKADTSLRDDFFEITPGEKCKNQDELQNELLINKDRFADEREQILNLSYKYIDGDASERIYDYLTKK
jgi:CDP-glycerol glycerophosphotransferase